MSENKDLGKLVSVHGMAPAHMQRAVFVVILSFIFFVAMMFVYYLRENIIYFLLASAFLLLYLVTLISFAMHRRNVVSVHENGLSYKGRQAEWKDVRAIDKGGKVTLADGTSLALPQMVTNSAELINYIRRQVANVTLQSL